MSGGCHCLVLFVCNTCVWDPQLALQDEGSGRDAACCVAPAQPRCSSTRLHAVAWHVSAAAPGPPDCPPPLSSSFASPALSPASPPAATWASPSRRPW